MLALARRISAAHWARQALVGRFPHANGVLFRVGEAGRLFGAGSQKAAAEISLTEACIQRMHELNKDGVEETFLRVRVDGGGCSGFQYQFEMDSKPQDGDRICAKDGVTVLVDELSHEFLQGSTIDFEEELIRSSFTVSQNPNADSSCGCGASFVAKF